MADEFEIEPIDMMNAAEDALKNGDVVEHMRGMRSALWARFEELDSQGQLAFNAGAGFISMFAIDLLLKNGRGDLAKIISDEKLRVGEYLGGD